MVEDVLPRKGPISVFISPKTKIPNLLFTGQNLNMHGVLGVTIGAPQVELVVVTARAVGAAFEPTVTVVVKVHPFTSLTTAV